jgi:hypothetical protein
MDLATKTLLLNLCSYAPSGVRSVSDVVSISKLDVSPSELESDLEIDLAMKT